MFLFKKISFESDTSMKDPITREQSLGIHEKVNEQCNVL